jgi:hypothetical protein
MDVTILQNYVRLVIAQANAYSGQGTLPPALWGC